MDSRASMYIQKSAVGMALIISLTIGALILLQEPIPQPNIAKLLISHGTCPTCHFPREEPEIKTCAEYKRSIKNKQVNHS